MAAFLLADFPVGFFLAGVDAGFLFTATVFFFVPADFLAALRDLPDPAVFRTVFLRAGALRAAVARFTAFFTFLLFAALTAPFFLALRFFALAMQSLLLDCRTRCCDGCR